MVPVVSPPLGGMAEDGIMAVWGKQRRFKRVWVVYAGEELGYDSGEAY